MESGKFVEVLTAVSNKIGVSENREDLIEEYKYFFRKNFDEKIEKYNRENFNVVIDTANGATYKVADEIFNLLGIKHEIIHNTPDGININKDCGSTHLESLKKYVIENNMSLGIAYDGDGDRCLAVDENGNELDGDEIIAIIAKYLQDEGKLNKNTIVATVMSNLGLNKFCQNNNICLKQTKVGDRYVLEEMQKGGYNLGGEQSGHTILLDYNPTGDGILTSIMLIQILLEKNMKASDIKNKIKKYPQVLVNVKADNKTKASFMENDNVKKAIDEVESELKDNGRILIRPSGTEPLIRIMIEGENLEEIQRKAEKIAKTICEI